MLLKILPNLWRIADKYVEVFGNSLLVWIISLQILFATSSGLSRGRWLVPKWIKTDITLTLPWSFLKACCCSSMSRTLDPPVKKLISYIILYINYALIWCSTVLLVYFCQCFSRFLISLVALYAVGVWLFPGFITCVIPSIWDFGFHVFLKKILNFMF